MRRRGKGQLGHGQRRPPASNGPAVALGPLHEPFNGCSPRAPGAAVGGRGAGKDARAGHAAAPRRAAPHPPPSPGPARGTGAAGGPPPLAL